MAFFFFFMLLQFLLFSYIGATETHAGNTDHWQIKNTSYCLNSPYRANNGNINVWTCDGNDNDQDWVWDGELIRLKNTNYCMNTPYRANNGNIFLWTCNSGDSDQKWVRDGEKLRLKNTNLCANNASRTNGGNVFLWTCDSNDADQKWVRGVNPPSGACPSGGLYCGGSVGQNPDNLYSCSGAGANPVLNQACSNGCQVNPPGTPDQCISGACPSGGLYCGGSVGQNPNNLYNCSGAGASPVLNQACSNGCQTNPPGTPDQCVGTCPTGGWYCGTSVGQNPNNLYYCSGAGANPQLNQQCSNGCQTNPPGTPDQCLGNTCPTGGWYCGESVGENPNNLYFCSSAGASPTLQEACSNGCHVNPPGTPDECEADTGVCENMPSSEWNGEGYYCDGNNRVRCSENKTTLSTEVCSYECSDGGSGNLNITEESKTTSIDKKEEIEEGSSLLPGAMCIPPGNNSSFCQQIPSDIWTGAGSYCDGADNLVFCSNNREAQGGNTCAWGCKKNQPGSSDSCLPNDDFIFPVESSINHKIETDFGFAERAHSEWLKCDGTTEPVGANQWHAGIDIIHNDALGTLDVTDHGGPGINTDQEIACKEASLGDEIVLTGTGVVTDIQGSPQGFDGNWITVLHDKEYNDKPLYSIYMHVGDVKVAKNVRYARGTTIGKISNYSNNPHLHYEMRDFSAWQGGYGSSEQSLLNAGYYDACQVLQSLDASVPASCNR